MCKNNDCTYLDKPDIPTSHATANRTQTPISVIPNLLHVAIDRHFALFQQLQNLWKVYGLDDDVDLIGKLDPEVIVATTLHQIQGSSFLHEKHFAGRKFSFFERKVFPNEVHEVVFAKPAFGGRLWGNGAFSWYSKNVGSGVWLMRQSVSGRFSPKKI